MNRPLDRHSKIGKALKLLGATLVLAAAAVSGASVIRYSRGSVGAPKTERPPRKYQAKKPIDTSGFTAVLPILEPWPPMASLKEVAQVFRGVGHRNIDRIDKQLAQPEFPDQRRIVFTLAKAALFHFDGEPNRAEQVLAETRAWLDDKDALAEQWLYSVIFYQGVTAMRLGENENCIECRGESSCILPISVAAIHQKPHGSRLAIERFTEYLRQFPDDLEVRWLLNLAHMTLGEHPAMVDPRYVISLDRFAHSEFDIGKFHRRRPHGRHRSIQPVGQRTRSWTISPATAGSNSP